MHILISDQSLYLFQNLLVLPHCHVLQVYTQTVMHVIVLIPWLPVRKPCDILQKCVLQRWKHVKDIKSDIMLEVKYKSNINEIIEEKSEPENADIATIWKTLDKQEFSERNLRP